MSYERKTWRQRAASERPKYQPDNRKRARYAHLIRHGKYAYATLWGGSASRKHVDPEYRRFRVPGLSFADVAKELRVERGEDGELAKGTKTVTRHTILGRMRQLKREAFARATGQGSVARGEYDAAAHFLDSLDSILRSRDMDSVIREGVALGISEQEVIDEIAQALGVAVAQVEELRSIPF